MNKSEPRKHHYIPQFILRKFTDVNNQVLYWNIRNKTLEKRNTKSIFMNIDMYRDEENHQENPVFIENSLSIFESEIANLINNKLLNDKEIIITRAELESLRIFLSLLSFRSDLRMNQYKNKIFDESTKNILGGDDVDFTDLWKREIDELSKCRSYKDIEDNENIDDIIKMDFLNDIRGYYMTFLDARGGEFLIGDVYPTLEVFPLKENVNIHLHCIYPLSSTRLLLLNHIMFKDEINDEVFESMKSISKIKGELVSPPKNKYVKIGNYDSNDLFIYKVNKIYESDIKYINALQLNESRIGIVFQNSDRVKSSISYYNSITNIKNDFSLLEEELKKDL